uniref:Uncharacterized protein n=1 Tax=Arundo donax TaxID=35708 RepID=A0A0A9AWW3_ARUDO
MARIIQELTHEKFPSPGEAASKLINEYSKYYQAKYKSSRHHHLSQVSIFLNHRLLVTHHLWKYT